MADMNDEYLTLQGVGTVVREPKTFTTKSGKKVCKFTIKANGRYQDVNAWERMAEMCKDLCPGEKVKIIGTPTAEEWTDRDGNKRQRYSANLERIERNMAGDRSADFAKYGPDVTPKVQPPKPSEPLPADPMEVADDIPF